MRKYLFIVILIFIIPIITCSQSTKNIGTWEGKTSQDLNITIKVEKVSGDPTVTELEYSIKMSGAYYSCTTTTQQPKKLSAKITNDKFSYSIDDFELSGKFEDNTLKGKLSSTNIHPQQGYGTATANVTFTLEKMKSN